MLQRSLAVILVAALAACAATEPEPGGRTGPSPRQVSNVNVVVGERRLDKSDWAPLEDQTAFDLTYDTYGPFDALGFEAGFSYAEDSSGSLDARAWEFFVGGRKTFSLASNHLHPYASLGLSLLDAQFDQAIGGTLSDYAWGFYLRGGVYYTISGGLNIGVDYRKLIGAHLSDNGSTASGEFDQLGVLVGFSF